jgi:cytochrome c-type biogenesis protein
MESLFTTLTHAVEGSTLAALSAAFVWGVLSILLSPCHLSSIPLIVGFISEQGEMTLRRAFGIAGLFSLGILVTIGLIGVLTATMGRMMGDIGVWGNYAVAVIFFLVGLHLLDIIPMPFSGPGTIGLKCRGFLAAFLLGALLLAFYGLGHCGVIVAAGTFTELVQRYLNWNEKSHGALILKRICGVLILLGGVYLIYAA